MKKTILALACALVAGSAFATGNVQTGVNASVRGVNVVVSGSQAGSSSSGAGSSSLSYASNTQTATAQVGVTGGVTNVTAPNCDTTLTGNVGITGNVTTTGQSVAYNVSTGTGTGSANAGGASYAAVTGSGSFAGVNQHGAIGGTVQGSAVASTVTSAVAGTNQSFWTAGASGASFEVSADASLKSIVGGTNTAYCDGKCGPATSDIKSSTTEVLTTSYSDQASGTVAGMPTGSTAGAGSVSTNAAANGSALSGAIGFVSATKIQNVVVTVPECKDDNCGPKNDRVKLNNGWGDGDQGAPGRSGPHNQAENTAGGKTHRVHGQGRPN